jgi:hypothetical protein
MTSKSCFKLILIGEIHNLTHEKTELLTFIKSLTEKNNLKVCFFYEAPVATFSNGEPVNEMVPDKNEIICQPLEPAIQNINIGEHLFLNQNYPSILTDLLYLMSSLQRFEQEPTIDYVELILPRISEVMTSLDPRNPQKLDFRQNLQRLGHLLKVFKSNNQDANYISHCKTEATKILDLCGDYLNELCKGNPNGVKVIELLNSQKDPIPYLQNLRNIIMIDTIRQSLSLTDCDVVVMIVGNDHVDDIQSLLRSTDLCISNFFAMHLNQKTDPQTLRDIKTFLTPSIIPQSVTDSSLLNIGDIVIINNLEKGKQYNGKYAIITNIPSDPNRLGVKIYQDYESKIFFPEFNDKNVAIKKTNMTKLDSLKGGRIKQYKSKKYTKKNYKKSKRLKKRKTCFKQNKKY